MDTRRGKSKDRGAEREGEGFLQRGQSRKARIEEAAARGWRKERQLLRSVGWSDEDVAGGSEEP